MARPSTDTRERLLAAAVDYAAEHGLADLSLRSLAAGLGTSHRMLIFHFGSKEGLLVEVVRAVEAQQRALLEGMTRVSNDVMTYSLTKDKKVIREHSTSTKPGVRSAGRQRSPRTALSALA